MNGRRGLVAFALIAATAAGGSDVPAQAGPDDLGCPEAMSAVTDMRADLGLPSHLADPNPAKLSGDFDPNQYFQAFPHLRMRDGYTLDYVYHQDGMGGYPLLYARPVDQPAYPDEAAYKGAGDQPNYLAFVIPQDNSEGYFEYAAFSMMANQFYLDWHANYNDWRVVCNNDGVEAIVASLSAGDSAGQPMSAQQQREARAIGDVPPTVVLTDKAATVTMLVFTKWGGFYRRTLVIDRRDHSILDEQNVPLVEYDCGIAF